MKFLTFSWLLLSIMMPVVASARTFYPPVRELSSAADTLMVTLLEEAAEVKFYAAEVRCAMPSAAQSRRAVAEWSMTWGNGVQVRVEFDLRGHMDGADVPEVTVSFVPAKGAEPVSARINSGIDFRGGANTLCVEWSDSVASVFAGSKRLFGVLSVRSDCPRGACVIAASGRVSVVDAVFEAVPSSKSVVKYSAESLHPDSLAGTAPLAGIWEYLNRDADESLAKIGGRYRLAIVPVEDGYDMVYLDGAVTNRAEWQPGMLKGQIRSLGFGDYYALTWLDAMFESMGSDCYVSVQSADVISFNFPLYSASMRFRRVKPTYY